MAKIAASLDNISKGRLDLGLGAGSSLPVHEQEMTSFGFTFPERNVRFDQLREYIALIREMWTSDEATYRGQYYSVNRAICNPKPLQKPGPPIVVAGTGQKILRTVVDLADGLNYWGSTEEYSKIITTLNRLCVSGGCDPSTIEKSWHLTGLIEEGSEAAVKKLGYLKRNAKTLYGEKSIESAFGGSPDDWTQLCARGVRIGISSIQVWFLDAIELTPLRIFAGKSCLL